MPEIKQNYKMLWIHAAENPKEKIPQAVTENAVEVTFNKNNNILYKIKCRPRLNAINS